ncbi:YggS family pyridoxal phosphate-dependent enzyme [Blattabacterium cuenoti]|uniref:YggS family pyridoxal phosphate-dependent enzyme n=1 Tax=Blattabacterium cuenoti TaxID=1653831 RepID=UPI00163B9E3F|nr:YggS family pyridoxal phosphate-dependent enzyme [Blattabacterium cuenoti]
MNHFIENNFSYIKKSIPKWVKILVVSKNQDIFSIKKLYQIGHRDFGENYVQEMLKKYKKLPKDIRWHMIGRIQSNKLKHIIPFIHLIHSVQKFEHIEIINKIGLKYNRVIHCLLQIKIGEEPSKSGITNHEAIYILEKIMNMKNIKIKGLMGMSSFHENMEKIYEEFVFLQKLYNFYKKRFQFNILSMGMSRDYNIAIKCGSTMIRLGTSIFRKN